MQIKIIRFLSIIIMLCAIPFGALLAGNAVSIGVSKYDLDAIKAYRKDRGNNTSYVFSNACEGGDGICVDDVFRAERVQMMQAVGLAKEYAKVRFGQEELLCSGQYHSKWNADYVRCVSRDGRNAYEFRFFSVAASIDSRIQDSVASSICRIYNGEVYYSEDACYCGNISSDVCNNSVAKSAERFDFDAKWYDPPRAWYEHRKTCMISSRFVDEDTYQLKSVYGAEPKKFVHFQIQSSDTLHVLLKRYMERMAAKAKKTLKRFECNYSFVTYRTSDFTNNPKDDLLRCVVWDEDGEHQMDFLFDDMNEFNDGIADEWNVGLKCIADKGGSFDGKACHAIDRSQCISIDGARWEPDLDMCLVEFSTMAALEQTMLKFSGVGLGIVLLGTAIGGPILGVAAAVGAIVGETKVIVDNDKKVEYMRNWLGQSKKCNDGNVKCALDSMAELLSEGGFYLDDMKDDQMNDEISNELNRLESIIPEDSEYWDRPILEAAAQMESFDNWRNWSELEWGEFAGKVLFSVGAIYSAGSAISSVAKGFISQLKFTSKFARSTKFTRLLASRIGRLLQSVQNTSVLTIVDTVDTTMDVEEVSADIVAHVHSKAPYQPTNVSQSVSTIVDYVDSAMSGTYNALEHLSSIPFDTITAMPDDGKS